MRWSVSSSVRTRDQGQSRTTLAGYPAKLRTPLRASSTWQSKTPPWYSAIVLECEDGEPGRGWFVDLDAFDPLEPCLTAAAAALVPAPAPSAMTNNAPVSVVVSVSQSASRTFPCPYCANAVRLCQRLARPAYGGLRRHIAKCH